MFIDVDINEIFNNDDKATEYMIKAINHCLVDAKYTGSAKFLAKLLLNRINSSKYPEVELNYFHAGADNNTQAMALGVIAVKGHPLGYFKEETADDILMKLDKFYSAKK